MQYMSSKCPAIVGDAKVGKSSALQYELFGHTVHSQPSGALVRIHSTPVVNVNGEA